GRKAPTVYQLHRQPRARIARSFPAIVRHNPTVQIICPTCVKRTVRAGDDISEACIVGVTFAQSFRNPCYRLSAAIRSAHIVENHLLPLGPVMGEAVPGPESMPDSEAPEVIR